MRTQSRPANVAEKLENRVSKEWIGMSEHKKRPQARGTAGVHCHTTTTAVYHARGRTAQDTKEKEQHNDKLQRRLPLQVSQSRRP